MYKIKRNEFIFMSIYLLLFSALFLDDMAFSIDVSPIIKFMKIVSLLLLILSTVSKRWNKTTFKEFVMVFLIGIMVLVLSGDIFFIIVILLAYNTIKIQDEKIYQLAFVYSAIGIAVTLFLFFIGILQDIISYRTDFSAEGRHSFGFNYSAILPLLIFYMLSYYIGYKSKRDKIKINVILFFLILASIMYELCKSRNAYYGIIALSFTLIILKYKQLNKWLTKPIHFLSKWITLICIIISVIPSILRSKNILMPLWYIYDTAFTNRSLLGASAIDTYGIHLFNRISYSNYVNTRVVVDSFVHQGVILDSAYMYILVRYGILILAFMYIILKSFGKMQQSNNNMCVVYCFIILLNMTDNDMLSYPCLPYLFIGLKNVWIIFEHRKKNEKIITT
ncbi:MAG: hypothetical protein V8Q93_16510 [Blautia faecis]